MGKERRKYTREFKIEAVRLMTEGVSVVQAARDLGVSQSIPHRWRRPLSSTPVHAFPGVGHLKPEAGELLRL